MLLYIINIKYNWDKALELGPIPIPQSTCHFLISLFILFNYFYL